MPRVVWSETALENLSSAKSYIAQFDPDAAERIADELYRVGESLAHFPQRGRPSAGGTREMVSAQPYILRYRVVHDLVVILRIRHQRRRKPARP